MELHYLPDWGQPETPTSVDSQAGSTVTSESNVPDAEELIDFLRPAEEEPRWDEYGELRGTDGDGEQGSFEPDSISKQTPRVITITIEGLPLGATATVAPHGVAVALRPDSV